MTRREEDEKIKENSGDIKKKKKGNQLYVD